jgi:hypothetical protein
LLYVALLFCCFIVFAVSLFRLFAYSLIRLSYQDAAEAQFAQLRHVLRGIGINGSGGGSGGGGGGGGGGIGDGVTGLYLHDGRGDGGGGGGGSGGGARVIDQSSHAATHPPGSVLGANVASVMRPTQL